MEKKSVEEIILQAKTKLVQEKVLKAEVLNKKIIAAPSHGANNYDWRYLSAVYLFK